MPVFVGPRWRDGEAAEGFVRVEKGRVVDEGDGAPAAGRPMVILDGVHNYHTHVGDAFLRGKPLPRSLPELVRPRTGYKHRMLASARASTLESAVRRALNEYAGAGTRSILDFREQGVPGIAWVRRTHRGLEGAGPAMRLLGRPTRFPLDGSELETLLDRSDGLGLPSVTDIGEKDLDAAARAAHRAHKPLALHVSEQKREDMEAVLATRPDLLVHLVAANKKDLRRVQDAGVPVVLCPSSNAFFGLRAPLRAVRRSGVRFFLGTDNAMLGRYDVVEEVRLARRRCPECPDEEFLRALTTAPEKAINHVARVPGETERARTLVLLPRRGRRVQWNARPLVVRR